MADADALREAGVPGLPVTPAPEPAPPTASPGGESVMSLIDHLSELRSRIFRVILAIVAGSVVGFYFATPIRDFLLLPLPGGTAQVLGPGDAFAIQKLQQGDGIFAADPGQVFELSDVDFGRFGFVLGNHTFQNFECLAIEDQIIGDLH